jgi:hypothetical protein
MKPARFTALAMVTAAVVAASVAATTAAAGTDARGAAATDQSVGALQVRFEVDRFVAKGKALVAKGDVVAALVAPDGTTNVTRKPFSTRVKVAGKTKSRTIGRRTQQAARICDILNLNLAPLRLALLGLIVELDRVVLTIKADSEGGLLGGLLCGLAGGSGLTSLTTAQAASRLTRVAQTSGLAAGPGFEIPLAVAATNARVQALPPVPAGHCTVLDLPLGPIDLNLLGLMVHLDATQLRITADPTGGLLGSLLCSLAGGPTTATPLVPTG